MSLTRRTTLALLGSALAAPGVRAQGALPFSGPMTIVAGFPPGGASDVLARLVADRLAGALGRPVLVENRAGAGGRIAAETVKDAPKDGSRLLLANTAIMVLSALALSDTRYDPVADFEPVSLAAEFAIAIASGPKTGATRLADLVAWLKANPREANFGVPAQGSLPHLTGVAFEAVAGVPLAVVPYRGGAPLATDLMGGQIAMGFSATADFAAHHQSGRLRVLAVTGASRAPGLADVPTFAEAGHQGFEATAWTGFFLPAGTPSDVVALLHRRIGEALETPEVATRAQGAGFVVRASSPGALGELVRADLARFRPLVERAGIRE